MNDSNLKYRLHQAADAQPRATDIKIIGLLFAQFLDLLDALHMPPRFSQVIYGKALGNTLKLPLDGNPSISLTRPSEQIRVYSQLHYRHTECRSVS